MQTRSIEHLVRTHQLAAARRAAGKSIWVREVKIKHLLDKKHLTTAEIAQAAQAIAGVLHAKLPRAWLDLTDPRGDLALIDLIDVLQDTTEASLDDGARAGFDPEEEFNDLLTELYDWADMARVWIG